MDPPSHRWPFNDLLSSPHGRTMRETPIQPRKAAAAGGRAARRASSPSGVGQLPAAQEIAAVKLLLEPWRWLTAPVFRHIDRVPRRRPFLLVGNHTLMGVLDVPLLLVELHERRGVLVRSLGDHLHFVVPIWRDLLARLGTVDGTRENCRALMRAGESILVFPGGGREVFKRKGEKYRLIWKDRLGFVRLAIEFGYPIVPFAAVGAEECYDIVADADDLRRSPLGPLLDRFAPRADEIPPIVSGIGPLPRPQRFYFHFSTPIRTTGLAGRQDDDQACRALRDRVQRAIERGTKTLLDERREDPRRDLSARLGGMLRRTLGSPARGGRRRSEEPLPARGAQPPATTQIFSATPSKR